ncbi:DUF645 family protein [Vibrio cholerae]|nr:DUF645 family protein [Vibrio cholerae]EKF9986044.1 DUF645 family protein [Vibrio cholerae]ELE5868307.1 DUF645 family protein [Vibrio cholerae]ELG7084254.1 DUF645 family protein [Vibrio cholerae]MCX9560760.1 DUF645 family protein [Vibrio cholerae]
MLSDVQHGQFGFTKGFITAEIMLSLPLTLTVLNLTMIVLSFSRQRHSFLCWTCVCLMHLRKMTFKPMC